VNKRHLHHVWTKIRVVRPWYFLIIATVVTAVCISALRANNEHMASLRQAVYTADQNNGDLQAALQSLQAYVTSHMNTSLSSGPNAVYPPIQLKYTYQRLLDSESAAAAQANSQLYTDAQSYCQGQIPTGFSGRYRVPCIEQYVESHDTTLPTIPTALYEFDFVSPQWSPDLAGWTMLAAIVSWLLFIVTFGVRKWLHHETE
jgi:hypothetical protein